MVEFCRRDTVIRVASVYAPKRKPERVSARNFSPHVRTSLTHLFPRYYVAILMLFLTEPKIVEALILLSLSGRVLSP